MLSFVTDYLHDNNTLINLSFRLLRLLDGRVRSRIFYLRNDIIALAQKTQNTHIN